MARYMIPPKMFSLTTFPGAFIIIFVFLILPFFSAGELGWKGFEDNLIFIIVSVALISLAGALWIAHWVEKRQAEESLDIDDEGITSTMRTRPHPNARIPLETTKRYQQGQSLTKGLGPRKQRVLWQDVRKVELRSRRSVRSSGTHYQVCLITDNDVISVPLNDETLGTRPIVEVDSMGHLINRYSVGKYPGYRLVQEIYRHLDDVPWNVKEEFTGQYSHKEKELAFISIDNPWSGDTIATSIPSNLMRKRSILTAVVLAIVISLLVCSFLFYFHSRERMETAKEEALRKAKANKELKATDESTP